MPINIIYKLLFYIFTCVFAFEDVLYVYGQGNLEMLEAGKHHYMLLKEQGNLPKYGKCWQSAIEHVHESCRNLNEDTQSDVALHLTNCFLEMSGHETYNCDSDKKENLRRICISNMSDRAFMVYTEFYTQTINICWFLRGQMWNEMIAENSKHLVNHLKEWNKKQDYLLKAQQKTLDVQEKLLKNEEHIEKFLQGVYASTQDHYKTLDVLLGTMRNLQNWLIGEISWFDSIIFYVTAILITFIFTATKRTQDARLVILLLLALNAFVEKLLANKIISNSENNASETHTNYYSYVWYTREFFICVSLIVLCRTAYIYKDYTIVNNVLLENLHKMNHNIYVYVKELHDKNSSYENGHALKLENHSIYKPLNGYSKIYLNTSSDKEVKEEHNYKIAKKKTNLYAVSDKKEQYNLRSRRTPDMFQ